MLGKDMISRTAQSVRRLVEILRREDGITMIVLLGVMTVTSLLVVAAFTSANGEIHLASTDTTQKKAYYAAEAGVEDYEYHLTQDGNYLAYCTSPSPANPALNEFYQKGTNKPETRAELEQHSVEVPEVKTGSSGQLEHSEEKYAIQLIPATSGEKKALYECNPNHLVETMVEEEGASTGTFRIKATGFSGKAEASIVATFRNANFVSYVWYTDYEVADPVIDGEVPAGQPANYWTECAHFYQERENLPKKQCQGLNNFFATGESVNGPIHVQDHGGVCGEPTFGRVATDRIEFGGGNNKEEALGYSTENAGGCGGATPTFKGTHIPPKEVPSIQPPPGDEELEHIVEPEYHFHGKTEFILENTTMTINKYSLFLNPVTKKTEVKITTTKNVAYPENGVIYVSGGTESGSCATYSPFGPSPSYTEDTECGNAYVHGKYEKSLTIASQNDIIINGSILTPTSPEDTPNATPTTNSLLGLIANNFVRIYHPVTTTRPKNYLSCGSAANLTTGPEPDLNNPIIYAAILAVKHSFIVDNFDCGAPSLGHLNLYGAVAGLFSNGMSGVINGTTLQSGYGYAANYDNRLQVEEPPHFLNPIQAAWYIQRQTLAAKP
jgi:Tfp pilus assembly protein PilX